MKDDDSMDSIGFEVKDQSMGVNSVKALRELYELTTLGTVLAQVRVWMKVKQEMCIIIGQWGQGQCTH